LLKIPKRHWCTLAKSASKRCINGPYDNRLLSRTSITSSLARSLIESVPTPITGGPTRSFGFELFEFGVSIRGTERVLDNTVFDGISDLQNTDC
jgi:hypothetical protein